VKIKIRVSHVIEELGVLATAKNIKAVCRKAGINEGTLRGMVSPGKVKKFGWEFKDGIFSIQVEKPSNSTRSKKRNPPPPPLPPPPLPSHASASTVGGKSTLRVPPNKVGGKPPVPTLRGSTGTVVGLRVPPNKVVGKPPVPTLRVPPNKVVGKPLRGLASKMDGKAPASARSMNGGAKRRVDQTATSDGDPVAKRARSQPAEIADFSNGELNVALDVIQERATSGLNRTLNLNMIEYYKTNPCATPAEADAHRESIKISKSGDIDASVKALKSCLCG